MRGSRSLVPWAGRHQAFCSREAASHRRRAHLSKRLALLNRERRRTRVRDELAHPHRLPDARKGRKRGRLPMSLKKTLMSQGMKLMSDPRMMKLMQNEQFMKAMMTAMSVPGRIDGFTKEQAERFAKVMRLATSREVKDLKRTVRALEEQLAELKQQRQQAQGESK